MEVHSEFWYCVPTSFLFPGTSHGRAQSNDHFKALTPARASHCTEGSSSWAFSWSYFQAFCTRTSCCGVYTAMTEMIAAFTGCSSEYKPVLTASYHQKVFTPFTAAVWLSSITQCTLCSLIKCIYKVYSEITCSLLKGGLDGKVYYLILIPKIIFDIVNNSLHPFLFFFSFLLSWIQQRTKTSKKRGGGRKHLKSTEHLHWCCELLWCWKVSVKTVDPCWLLIWGR